MAVVRKIVHVNRGRTVGVGRFLLLYPGCLQVAKDSAENLSGNDSFLIGKKWSG